MSILSRLSFSLAGNVTRSALNILSTLVIARVLGPADYGAFAFLLASFTALTGVLDMGTSSAFFTFISKRNRAKAFIVVYFLWLAAQFLLSLSLIYFIFPDSWVNSLWQGESVERILIAFVAVFLQNQLWQAITQLGESQRLTVRVQVLNVIAAVLHLVLILLLVEHLSVELIFLLLGCEFVFICLIAALSFPVSYVKEPFCWRTTLGDYAGYCAPLLVYSWLAVLTGFADAWLLRHFAGSVQQAYYAIAMQFAGISLIATRSALKILWKEVAEANSSRDEVKVKQLYTAATKALFVLGAIVSGAVIPWSEEIIQLMLGEAYRGGGVVLSLMLLYPIHQSLGQLNGAMFFALELTKPYVWIGGVFSLVNLLLLYFLLAPGSEVIPGLGLGAIGMGLKMIIGQLLYVNVLQWFLSKSKGWHFDFGFQFKVILVFLGTGLLSYQSLMALMGQEGFLPIRAALFIGIYISIIALLFWQKPQLLGLSNGEKSWMLSKLPFLNKV